MARHEHLRPVAAWVCLLAVALLYAPLVSIALVTNGVDCCAGGYCKIPEHRHHKHQLGHEHPGVPAAPAETSGHMDCGHESSDLMACSMSCCQDQARPALMPSAFLLPFANFVPTIIEEIRPVQIANSFGPSGFVKPLSPPPRFASPILYP
jgi:hypothetical protein